MNKDACNLFLFLLTLLKGTLFLSFGYKCTSSKYTLKFSVNEALNYLPVAIYPSLILNPIYPLLLFPLRTI